MNTSTYKVKTNKNELTIPYLISDGLENCASLMPAVSESIQVNNYERLFNQTQEIVGILTNLDKLVPHNEKEPVFKTLHDYFEFAEAMIQRMNVKRDIELCKAMEKSFRDVGTSWRQSVDALTRQ